MNSKKIRDLLLFILIFLAILAVWWGVWWWIDANVTVGSAESREAATMAARGQFGDKFGAVNALFSGFAFAGIIITLLLQRRDLSETREAMDHERFDNTFFQLLRLHIDITRSLSIKGGLVGHEAFDRFIEHFRASDPDFHVFSALQKISRDRVRTIIDTKSVVYSDYPELNNFDIANIQEALKTGVRALENFLDDSLEMHEKRVVTAYAKSASENIDYFSHYFRNLYHILKFIDESRSIDHEKKIRYAKFVRSQLSDVELVTLFYNSIARIALPGRENIELGYPKMQAYLKKYDILQNMNPRSLVHPIHLRIFNKNAEA